MKVKMFTDTYCGIVETACNDWIKQQGDKIDVTRIQLCTCGFGRFDSVNYTIMVEYNELS